MHALFFFAFLATPSPSLLCNITLLFTVTMKLLFIKTLIRALLISLTLVPVAAHSKDRTPLRVIVGYSAGGAVDISARKLSHELSSVLDRPVIVENSGGGSGIVAMNKLIHSPLDGNTVLFADSRVLYTNWYAFEELPYSLEDFILGPVFLRASFILATHKDSDLSNHADLPTWIKTKGKNLNFVTAGVNSPHHLLLQRIEESLDTELTHIPMRGDTQAVTEVLSARADLGFFGTVTALSHLSGGNLIPLAVVGDERLIGTELEYLPTLDDVGLAGIENQGVMGLAYPKGTSVEKMNEISEALRSIAERPDVSADLLNVGFIPYHVDKDALLEQIKKGL